MKLLRYQTLSFLDGQTFGNAKSEQGRWLKVWHARSLVKARKTGMADEESYSSRPTIRRNSSVEN